MEAELYTKDNMSGPLFQKILIEMEEKTKDIDELYRIICVARMTREFSDDIFDKVGENLIERFAFDQKSIEILWDQYDWEMAQFLVEKVAGYWDEECNDIFDEQPYRSLKPGQKKFPPYTFDAHTQSGRELLLEHWKDIAPGKPLPNNIDMRWSGQYQGILWRELAYKQFKMDYKDKKWEEVKIARDVWEKTVMADTLWGYNGFYNEVIKRYGNVIQ